MKPAPSKRRTFTVREQLVAKLGSDGYSQFLQELRATVKPKRRRTRKVGA
jgi:hypothetical protein